MKHANKTPKERAQWILKDSLAQVKEAQARIVTLHQQIKREQEVIAGCKRQASVMLAAINA